MIKRTSTLPLALAAALAVNDVTAVHLDAQGLGQVLIYPYYTVHAGQVTLFTVVNFSGNAKAVKVRFREAIKGRSVLDFNLYLSPYDAYAAALVAESAEAPARLVTLDTSCTVPAGTIDASVVSMDFRYTGDSDGAPAGLERTREGAIEIIEMGVVADTNNTTFNIDTSYSDALSHVGGQPGGCHLLRAAWDGGRWSANPTHGVAGTAGGVSSPTGELYGSAVIVDVANGVAFPYAADALGGFYLLSETRLHTPPGSDAPDLSDAETSPGQAQARIFANGRPVDLNFVSGRPDAVSAVLMSESLLNEYSIEPALDAASEWVVSFPTRYLHQQEASLARRRPFTASSEACEEFSVAFFDREEGPEAPAPFINNGNLPARAPKFCYQTNILSWRDDEVAGGGRTPLLASRLYPDLGDTTGRLPVEADGGRVPAGHAAVLYPSSRFLLDGVENGGQSPRQQVFGLPATGFWVANYVNAAAAPGRLANYSTLMRHRAKSSARTVLVSGEGTPTETITPTGGR